jgi:hypothetical protein
MTNASMILVGASRGGIIRCGMADVSGKADADAVVCAVSETAAGRGRERLRRSVERAVARRELGATDAGRAHDSVPSTDDLSALADRELSSRRSTARPSSTCSRGCPRSSTTRRRSPPLTPLPSDRMAGHGGPGVGASIAMSERDAPR